MSKATSATVYAPVNVQQPRAEQPTARSGTRTAKIASLEDARTILTSESDHDGVISALFYLNETASSEGSIWIPSSQSTRVVRAIIETTVPDFWQSGGDLRNAIIRSLSSGLGIEGLLAQLRKFVGVRGKSNEGVSDGSKAFHGRVFIEALEAIMGSISFAWTFWQHLEVHAGQVQKRLLWKDFVAVLTSGKIISVVAEYVDTANEGSVGASPTWLASGSLYTARLATQVSSMAGSLRDNESSGWEAVAMLLSRSLHIGYTEELIRTLLEKTALHDESQLQQLARLAGALRPSEQAKFWYLMLIALTRMAAHLSEEMACKAISAIIQHLLGFSDTLGKEIGIILQIPQKSTSLPLHTRRACFSAISHRPEIQRAIFQSNVGNFGEALFIKHAPTTEQRACAENILLAAAYLRTNDMGYLSGQAKSSAYMNTISNRLNASSDGARTLGMCIAMAISRAVDKAGSKLNFDVEDARSSSAQSLLALIETSESVGCSADIENLSRHHSDVVASSEKAKVKAVGSVDSPAKGSPVQRHSAPLTPVNSGNRIVEVLSDDDEDEDIEPYSKPDSDPEDSEDDPTLINRDKQRAPVYIRDLIAGLREGENYDRHKLALQSAPSLIRRKAPFGKEVSDHAIELGTILASLQDHFELDDFIDLRLQSLIALIVSSPTELGPWLARQAFEGDYSTSQRGTLLSAIGLSARELAGHTDPPPTASFPSKRLPEKYHAMYASTPASTHAAITSTTPVSNITAHLTDTLLAPLAATAADAQTGPNALKIRTFSSRLDPAKTAARTRKIPNTLAATLTSSFFTPLLGAFYTAAGALLSSPSSAAARRSPFLSPVLLSTFLKTVGICLVASGQGTVGLPALTGEMWELLLAVRKFAEEDESVMEATLFGFLVLLEVNEDSRRLAGEMGREVVEAREWVSFIYERLPAGEGGQDRVRGLAAGVVVKLGEVIERYQRLMVGELMDY